MVCLTAPFHYHRPDTLAEALALLAEYGPDAMVLAGGQSLMPLLALRLARPKVLVDINRLPELGKINANANANANADTVVFGATVRHVEVLEAARGGVPLLALALPYVAHAAIRNRGTLCGSLALADPAAEAVAVAIALDAVLSIESKDGSRKIGSAAFFRGLYDTALAPGELITSVEFPRHTGSWRFAFREAVRRRGDYAMAGIALGLDIRDSTIVEARVATLGIEAASRRLHGAEEALIAGDRSGARAALEAALDPMPDRDLKSAHKRRMAGTLFDEAVMEALDGRR